MRLEDHALALPPGAGARRVVLALLAEAEAAAEDLAAGRGDEPLHDFRVALRRLRSALRTYRPWLGKAVRRRDLRRLKRIARSTGTARDAEVQLVWLAERRAEVTSPRHLPGHAAAVAFFDARRDAGPKPAKVARRLRRVARKLERRLARGGAGGAGAADGARFGPVLGQLVLAQVATLAERVAAIRDAADVEGAHRARIEGKRLRYLLEPMRGSRRADASALVAGLKRLQDLLGELHDAHVLGAELGDALAAASAERGRGVHRAVLSGATGAVRGALRQSPRPGLLALVRIVRERRDGLFAAVEAAFRGGEIEALAAGARGVAGALEGEARTRGARVRVAARRRGARGRRGAT